MVDFKAFCQTIFNANDVEWIRAQKPGRKTRNAAGRRNMSVLEELSNTDDRFPCTSVNKDWIQIKIDEAEIKFGQSL